MQSHFFDKQLSGYESVVIDQGPFYPDPSSGVEVWVRRLDLLDPVWGGNKYFKLKGHIEKARNLGYNKLISFGGAYSNHIAALARIGKILGFETTGIIRGEPEYITNITLSRAKADGMDLRFVSRTAYKNRNQAEFINSLQFNSDQWYLIPEGGSGPEGALGCRDIMRSGDQKFDVIAVCFGTGATAAGIASMLHPGQTILGFSVLNDEGELDKHMYTWAPIENNGIPVRKITRDYTFGGFAKSTPELTRFIQSLLDETGIAVEPVYTAKMFFGIYDMIRKRQFPVGCRILAIHTGGLQYLNP